MSNHLSSGTLDSMAGVFSPSRKYRLGAGGGKAHAARPGEAMLGFAVASMFPKATGSTTVYRPSPLMKRAFGGSSRAAVGRRAIAIMERTSRRVPEVMVRVTGRQHGGGHVLANFSYISRLGHGPDKELGLHTSEGDVIHDGREMQLLAQEWHEWEMGDDARRKGATSLSMILSMPTGTDPERVREAALDFAREEFAGRSWVASLHVDRDHPHVHLTIARRDHDGRRFHPDRDDLFRWRQRFAAKLRDRGIEANATPAKARGIDATHEHIAARKVREKGGAPHLDKTRAARARRFRETGRSDPVDAVLREQRETVRAAYERSIAELSASPSMIDQMVAKSLRRFVDEMPEPEPNSLRAVHLRDHAHHAGDRVGPAGRSDRTGSESDVLASALDRLRAAQQASRMPADKSEGADARQAGEQPRQGGLSDRLRGLMEKSGRQSGTEAPDSTAEILRQAQDRDRAHRDRERDRDRPPEKNGPHR